MTDPIGTPYGPCDTWPVRWTCNVSAESPSATGIAVAAATQVLHALSGRQFGLCTATLRPCHTMAWGQSWDTPYWWSPWPFGGGPMPALVGGLWYNLCGDGGFCSCHATAEARLPARVHRIVQVKVDGVPLASGAYRVDDGRILVRVDGGVWPRTNDIDLDDSKAGTWSVAAQFGQPVPEVAELAMGELACEFLRSIRGEDCRLPRNVTSLARQGVTIQMADLSEVMKLGKTGFPVTDMFLQATNPGKLTQASKSYSVDRLLARRTNT
jgi:hypothetical protein